MKRQLPAEAYQFAEMYRLGKPTTMYTADGCNLVINLIPALIMCFIKLTHDLV
jgi:hypothetical protein